METERDPREWLIQRVREGWSQYDLERELNKHHPISKPVISQPTISRNIERVEHGQDITKKTRSAILALFPFEEEEAKKVAEEHAQIEANQLYFLDFLDALEEWQVFDAFEAEKARIANEQRQAAEKAFKARQEKARARGRAVNDRIKAQGLMDADHSFIHGDGARFIREGNPDFHYATEGAETLGFMEPDKVLPGGKTVRELTEGITAEERMQESMVPDGQARPEMIGLREAAFVTAVPYIDGPWFWGELQPDIVAWYELRDTAPAWWKEGQPIPRMPEESDVSWYRNVFKLETKLLKKGLSFERSILGWSDDWASEVDEKQSSLQTLEHRHGNVDAASDAGTLVVGLAGVAAALALIWFAVIPLLRWILRGVVNVWNGGVTTYHDTVHAIETSAEWLEYTTEVVVTSPVTAVVLLVAAALVLWAYPTPLRGRSDPAHLWVLGVTMTVGIAGLFGLVIWAMTMIAAAASIIP